MAKQLRSLTGKVAVVTGGGRGIGKALSRSLAREGVRVAIADLDGAAAEQAASEIGGGAIGLALDVTDRPAFTAALDEIETRLGPIDVLVNNAGIMQVGHTIWEEDDATTQRMIDINVNGVMHGVKEIVPRFLARGRGHVVNVASTAGKGGFPGGGTYCGTKHYVVGLTEALRAELRGTGVEVSCVMPVVVNTELASGLTETRGVKTVQPDDVAGEIVSALQDLRFDVFVPRSVAGITKVMNLLPRNGREGLSRALKADQVLMQIDEGKRAAYELRASKSDPSLEAGDPTRQLTP